MPVVHVKYESLPFNLKNLLKMKSYQYYPTRFLDIWSSENNMRFSRKELFIVQEEIIESMKSPSSKAMIASSYISAQNNSISIRTLHLRIKRQIIQGYSSFKNLEEIKEVLDYKRYMIKNSHIYGDYNENKIQNT